MKKIFFAVAVIFFVSQIAFAERGDTVLSLDAYVPFAWKYPEESLANGFGLGVNKTVLPGELSLMGVDYGANLSVPFQLLPDYIAPVNSQMMFGILFMPFNFEKWYFGVGGALGISMSYSLQKDAVFEESNFAMDFGVGLETRGGVMLTEKYALTFGCTALYDFYKLDVPHRRYIRENVFVIQPSIGIGIRK